MHGKEPVSKGTLVMAESGVTKRVPGKHPGKAKSLNIRQVHRLLTRDLPRFSISFYLCLLPSALTQGNQKQWLVVEKATKRKVATF